ncbi:MAG: META domain-containing protein [Pseudomonadota bacterium]
MRKLLPLCLFLAACGTDQTISSFVDPSATYTLQELDGETWTSQGSITFPEKGSAIGQAPCNKFFANQKAPYPWVELEPIATTRMACPDMVPEQRFLEALRAMGIAEVSGDTLILSNDAGRQMVFQAAP